MWSECGSSAEDKKVVNDSYEPTTITLMIVWSKSIFLILKNKNVKNKFFNGADRF